jgi:hypothetical protein
MHDALLGIISDLFQIYISLAKIKSRMLEMAQHIEVW